MSKSKPLSQIVAQWDVYERPKDGDRYRHYKGDEYEIVATGFMEALEVPAVIYRSLEKDIIWVRTAENFFEKVEVAGRAQPRFIRIKGVSI